ncbi:bromodomain-containing protein 7 [Caerostris extrusa]|uniref:Bromodomain-containing protein 7 n=1 Tax=Caerostris extrusa TaxID=172846 RepID=A0AAV4SGV2_CAEEX|nr:bromodomain-containing protein 7 [Caerostris extrusa]
MGSKKHKKHHKSEKKDLSFDDHPAKRLKLLVKSEEDRQEKPLKLVLKVGGNVQSPVHASNSNSSSSQIPRIPQDIKPVFEETKVEKSSSHSHEKHKKSKKKKKKKSTDKDKERKRRKEQESSRLLTEAHDSRDSLPVRAVPEPHPIIPVEKPTRDVRKKTMKTPLQILLYFLLKKLQVKDPNDFCLACHRCYSSWIF